MRLLIFRNAFTSFVKEKSVYIPQAILLVAFTVMSILTGIEANNTLLGLLFYLCDISILVLSISLLNIQYISLIFIKNRSVGVLELELRSGYPAWKIYFERLFLNVALTVSVSFISIILFALFAIPTSHNNAKVANIYSYGFFSIFAFDILVKGIAFAFVAAKKSGALISIATFLTTVAVVNPCIAMGTQLDPGRADTSDYIALNYAIQSSNIIKENENGILASIFNSLKQPEIPEAWTGDNGVIYLNPKTDQTGEFSEANHWTGILYDLNESLGFSSELLRTMYQNQDYKNSLYNWYSRDDEIEVSPYNPDFSGDSFEIILGDKAKKFYDSTLVLESDSDYSEYWKNNLFFTGKTNSEINIQSETSAMKKTLNSIKIKDSSLKGEWSKIKELLSNLYESKVVYAYNKGPYIYDALYNDDYIISNFGQDLLPHNELGENDWKLPISLLDTFKNINPYMLQIRAMINWLGSINVTNTVVRNLSFTYDEQQNDNLQPFTNMFGNSIYEGYINSANVSTKDKDTINSALPRELEKANKTIKLQYKIPFNIYTSLLFNMGLDKSLNSYYDDETISRDKSIWNYKDLKIVVDNDEATEYDEVNYIKEVSVGGLAYSVALAMIMPMIIGVAFGALGYLVFNKKIIL